MSLSDEYAGMMDTFGKSQLEHLGLEPTFQEVLKTQTQHIIKLHFALIQYSNTNQTTQEGITFEQNSAIVITP